MADHINAMHLERKAFIECEADRVLKTASKKRVYAGNDNFAPGDWVYYKNKSKRWEGPIQITILSGKLLYAVRAGILLTINTDHVVLVKLGDGEVLSRDTIEPGAGNNLSSVQPGSTMGLEDQVKEQPNVQFIELREREVLLPRDDAAAVAGSLNSPPTREESFPRTGADIGERQGPGQVQNDTGEVIIPNENLSNTDFSSVPGDSMEPETVVIEENPSNNHITYKEIKSQTIIKFKQPRDSDWAKGQVLSWAGKVTNKYQHFWNITNLETNHTQPMNMELFESIEKVSEGGNEQSETACFLVNIPRWRQGDKKCPEVKQAELKKMCRICSLQGS